MIMKFVKTENSARFLNAVGLLQRRAAAEACLMIVDGLPGLGKTVTLDWWATENDCVFLRAKKQWSPSWMLREILAGLNITPENSFEKMFEQAVAALDHRRYRAGREAEVFAIVVDEADHISRSEKLMDTLRDFSDVTNVPVILVGMGKIRHHLTRFPQVASRVSQYVEFQPASLEDFEKLVAALCEVDVKADLIKYLHTASNGLFREALDGINSIEVFGNHTSGPIGRTEMAGEVLMKDRQTNKPMLVRD